MTGLRPDRDTGFFPLRHAVGKIIYPGNDGHGYLVYIQTALTGKEPEDILSYQRQYPHFPDQSTIDQFFDEAQFESYRKLGETSVKELFPEKTPGFHCADAEIRDYFHSLYAAYGRKCRILKAAQRD
ncbi:MAG: hypothetical protein JXA71_02180 [Chitinispirillaceae bacterium]|nr:hypothetical protein [Chitinispirillaceae bacterium]